MFDLDTSITGELVDLKIPFKEFSKESNWYNLFNQQNTVSYLEQGLCLNTPEKQEEFFIHNEGRQTFADNYK